MTAAIRRMIFSIILCAAVFNLAPVSTASHQPPRINLPPTSGVFDYQLGAAYDSIPDSNGSIAIDVVARDSTADPLQNAYNICYINGFQTQPGEEDLWLSNEHLLLHDEQDQLVIDPNWPDEYILDPSTESNREAILAALEPTFHRCADAGFDGIDLDNLDTFTRFPQIDQNSAMTLAAMYVNLGHNLGLAVGQKNTAEISEYAHTELGFDFAITESCAAWDECAAFTEVYGEHVLQIEYPDELQEADITFENVCESPYRAPLTILRDRLLVSPESAGYVYESC